MTSTKNLLLMIAAVCFGHLSASAIEYAGINLAGAEFGEGDLRGTYGTQYIYPNGKEVNYFKSKGMNIIRLCFRWERLQQSLGAELNAAELGRLDTFVTETTAKGMYVILDPHNYARYANDIIGSDKVPIPAFCDFWSRLAAQYKSNDRVIFGLMNEPHDMSTEVWRDAAQAAIHVIRESGAKNLILVPGNGWTGAHSWSNSWYGTPNAEVMLSIQDPITNFAFEVHQYLDDNSSGTATNIVNEQIGAARLADFTQWCRKNHRKGFLGEFAVANSTLGAGIGDEAISHMLKYMNDNADVWLGWTWWAAGPWWTDYMFSIEPVDDFKTDRPVMDLLEPYIPGASM